MDQQIAHPLTNDQECTSAKAAADYARATPPLDQDMGWRRDDIELAFIAGAEWRALQNE